MSVENMLARATAAEGDPHPVPRVVAVFAHPDDETIALGGRIRRFKEAHFVHVTDGAPANGCDSRSHGLPSVEQYRMVRAQELRSMFEEAGLADVSRESFALPDQEASLHLAELSERLSQVLRRQSPEVVFTHPYEGGHPDHDACAFAVHTAAAILEQSSPHKPLLVEAAFYHAGSAGIETGTFLPSTQPVPQKAWRLTEEERNAKAALLACFGTQADMLRYFQLDCERYRVAPSYDFRQPPHAGSAFYDRFPWGMSSPRFSELAANAQSSLQAGEAMRCE